MVVLFWVLVVLGIIGAFTFRIRNLFDGRAQSPPSPPKRRGEGTD